ncbi:NS3 [St Croix River virus]|uniref:NS3 n=1 Tax=St Croix River virus TaxID=104581 RepID=Q9DSP0_9REOV|nr:NS3 [St Croix River virus]AAG34266.1 NS3 [St Croix River virus]
MQKQSHLTMMPRPTAVVMTKDGIGAERVTLMPSAPSVSPLQVISETLSVPSAKTPPERMEKAALKGAQEAISDSSDPIGMLIKVEANASTISALQHGERKLARRKSLLFWLHLTTVILMLVFTAISSIANLSIHLEHYLRMANLSSNMICLGFATSTMFITRTRLSVALELHKVRKQLRKRLAYQATAKNISAARAPPPSQPFLSDVSSGTSGWIVAPGCKALQ